MDLRCKQLTDGLTMLISHPRSFRYAFLITFLFISEISCTGRISIPGEIVLGGIFPIHQKGKLPVPCIVSPLINWHSSGTNIRSKNGDLKSLCGALNKDRGVQRVEAMLFAIDKINNDPSLLPNIKVGAIILDTCSSDTYALNQSLEFIRASINTAFESSAFECPNGMLPRPRQDMRNIYGVVGGSYSEVSLQVANLFRLFRIPQVNTATFDLI